MHKNSLRSMTSILGSASIVIGLSAFSCPAQAGFQWVPSSGAGSVNTYQNQVATAPVPRSAPVPSVQRVQPRTTAFDAMPMVQISSDETPKSAAQTLEPPAGAIAEPSLSSKPVMSDKPLKGFANNVPLSVALRQILPQEYGYSVAPEVNLGTLVSWKGGDSWHGTLSKMLSASDLAMQEKGQVIHIVRGKGSAGEMTVQETPTQSTTRPVSRVGAAPSLQSLKAGSKPMSLGTLARDDMDEPSLGGASLEPAGRSMRSVASRGDDLGASSAARDMMVVNSWRAERGETLRKTLERWGQNSGVEVVWQSEYDYPLQASVSLSGTFEEAVRNLLTGLQDAKPQPTATLHAGKSGGAAILVVGVRGNNYSE